MLNGADNITFLIKKKSSRRENNMSWTLRSCERNGIKNIRLYTKMSSLENQENITTTTKINAEKGLDNIGFAMGIKSTR
jgi:hypothetical protein